MSSTACKLNVERVMKKILLTIMLVFSFIFTCSLVGVAADYYVDATRGDDSNPGINSSLPWKTLAKVTASSFNPGDNIFLKRGEVWEERLQVSSSGESGNPITYTAYGTGPNPKIKCTVTYSNWELILEESGKKIWRGTGIKSSYGAMKDGVRLPMYLGYTYSGDRVEKIKWSAPDNISEMKNGLYYAPEDSSENFYLRWDTGNPGTVEIGKQKYGIYVKDKNFITIDSIDIYGPGGSGWSSTRQITIISSDHINVKNCVLSFHNNGGIVARDGSTNCTYEKINSFGHRNTGLYFWEAGSENKMVECEVHNCGNVSTDNGDMGLIAAWKTPGVVIERCYVHDNGGEHINSIDAAISFAMSPNAVVRRCLVKNVGGTAIQLAENSDNGLVAYNVIMGWGVFGSFNMNEGIRIGGGAGPSAKNCRVYNNLLINDGKIEGKWAALRVVNQENEGLQVVNNIFYNNLGIYEIFVESKDNFKNWIFKNNLYYRTGGNAVNWSGTKYDYLHILGDETGFYSKDRNQESGSIKGDPLLNLDKMGITSTSPCIDSGINVGLTEDYYGNPVSVGNGVDIGPFEFQSGRLLAPTLHKIGQ